MPIYLNAASHGMPAPETLHRMRDYLASEAQTGTHAAESAADAETPAIRAAAAQLLAAQPAQIALGTTTSQFWQTVLARMPLAGRRVLLSAHEWGTHLRYLQHIVPAQGLVLDVIPEPEGLDPAAWAARIDDDLAAILLQHVTSAQGQVYPVADISALPRPDHCLAVVDAAQALGRVPTDMNRIGCDVLIATTRKWMRGPRSTAVMALSPRAETALGTPAQGLDVGDYDRGLRLGMGAALASVQQNGLAAHIAGIAAQEQVFRAALARNERIAEWMMAGRPAGPAAPGHITLRLPADQRAALDRRMTAAGIVAKWSMPAHEEPLSAAATDTQHALLRITPHLYNTAAEAEALAAALTG